MKTLVTHINPHLDDISAIWLFKKFHPEFAIAKIEFISQSKTDKIAGSENDNRVFFGVGKGRFDEHKGDLEDCATSLVWKEIKKEGLAPKDEFELAAYDELVEWNRLLDTATFPNLPYGDFTVPAFIRPTTGKREDSLEAVELGEKILQRILQLLIKKQKVKKDWQNHLEFETRWGKAAALKSDEASRAIVENIGGEDFNLFLIKSPKDKSVQIFTPKEGIDLTPLYIKVSELDPEASWYLHHAKRMILCGSGSAPDSKPTRLTLDELIGVAKSTP